jgi:uncharacterized protein (TIGR00255 family)
MIPMTVTMKSMTGFGRAQFENEAVKITCEIKSLNGKYLEADIRLPRVFADLDAPMRRMLSELLERGTLSVTYQIKWLKPSSENQEIVINFDAAQNYLTALKSLSNELGVELHDPMREILKLPDLIGMGEREISSETKQHIVDVTKMAALELDKFRQTEGQATAKKLTEFLNSIESDLFVVEGYEGDRREAIRERVYGNVLEYISQDAIDQNRLEQEVLIYLDKYDIAEEKQRLGQHIDFFRQSLKSEPKGRKLNFISQEMGREMNTMGVKSNFFPMQQAVVGMKEKLEQIKEQVLNIV